MYFFYTVGFSCIFYAIFRLLYFLLLRQEDKGVEKPIAEKLCFILLIPGLVGAALCGLPEMLYTRRSFDREKRALHLARYIGQMEAYDIEKRSRIWSRDRVSMDGGASLELWARSAFYECSSHDFDDVFPGCHLDLDFEGDSSGIFS